MAGNGGKAVGFEGKLASGGILLFSLLEKRISIFSYNFYQAVEELNNKNLIIWSFEGKFKIPSIKPTYKNLQKIELEIKLIRRFDVISQSLRYYLNNKTDQEHGKVYNYNGIYILCIA